MQRPPPSPQPHADATEGSSQHAARPEACDVLVIGAGPAGSTMAALLANKGRKVVLLEKCHHPRFHIGESLLPANVPLLEALGLRDQVQRIGMPKWGVEFVSPHHEHPARIEFAEAWNKSLPMAWQVRRAEFDQLLFEHAQHSGAQTLQGCQVQSVQFDDEGAWVQAVTAHGAKQSWRTAYVVDASGRDTLLARQMGIKHKNPRHNSAAIFGHFSGAQRLQGEKLEGNISIFWFQHGWFWFIPLADGSTSVGATCWPHYLKSRDKPLEAFFFDTIAMCPPLAQRLQAARLIDNTVHATGNYSYSASHASGARYQMLGDAFAFVDPVFSSGVYLAMASAFQGLDLVQATLDGDTSKAARARKRFEAHMRRGPREFSWFILRMTNPAMRELFMHPRNVLRAKEAVMSVLAGDVFGHSPAHWPKRAALLFFKGVYHANALVHWRSTWKAWRLRRHLIRDVGALSGESVALDAR